MIRLIGALVRVLLTASAVTFAVLAALWMTKGNWPAAQACALMGILFTLASMDSREQS